MQWGTRWGRGRVYVSFHYCCPHLGSIPRHSLILGTGNLTHCHSGPWQLPSSGIPTTNSTLLQHRCPSHVHPHGAGCWPLTSHGVTYDKMGRLVPHGRSEGALMLCPLLWQHHTIPVELYILTLPSASLLLSPLPAASWVPAGFQASPLVRMRSTIRRRWRPTRVGPSCGGLRAPSAVPLASWLASHQSCTPFPQGSPSAGGLRLLSRLRPRPCRPCTALLASWPPGRTPTRPPRSRSAWPYRLPIWPPASPTDLCREPHRTRPRPGVRIGGGIGAAVLCHGDIRTCGPPPPYGGWAATPLRGLLWQPRVVSPLAALAWPPVL